ncbi:MAG: hypothetical protein ACFE85_10505 [Candidatus Hodarchaeota archaeon]
MKFAIELSKTPIRCLGCNKCMLNYSQYNELVPVLTNEFKLYCKNITTSDFGKRMKSFQEKRKPLFKGK